MMFKKYMVIITIYYYYYPLLIFPNRSIKFYSRSLICRIAPFSPVPMRLFVLIFMVCLATIVKKLSPGGQGMLSGVQLDIAENELINQLWKTHLPPAVTCLWSCCLPNHLVIRWKAAKFFFMCNKSFYWAHQAVGAEHQQKRRRGLFLNYYGSEGRQSQGLPAASWMSLWRQA